MSLNLSKRFSAMTSILTSDFDVVFNQIRDFINNSLDASVVKDSAKVGGFTASKTPTAGQVVVVDDDGKAHVSLAGSIDTTTTANNLALQGEADNAVFTYSPVSIDLGTVSIGDRIFVQAEFYDLFTTPPTFAEAIITQLSAGASGEASIVYCNDLKSISIPWNIGANSAIGSGSGVFKVTTAGTLALQFSVGYNGSPVFTFPNRQMYAFFLKKA
jgi:hypothetical protein